MLLVFFRYQAQARELHWDDEDWPVVSDANFLGAPNAPVLLAV